MSEYSTIVFSIDYKIDSEYNNDDETIIYYNCGDSDILGLMISKSNNNTEIHKSYKNTGFALSILCNYRSDIIITITQNGDNYFNFENACLTGTQSTISPSINPTIITSIPTVITDVPTIKEAKSNVTKFLEKIVTIDVYIIISIIFGLCISLSLMAILHRMGIFNKCLPIGDSDSFIVFIILGFRLSDLITDILFAIYISEFNKTVDDTELLVIYVTSIATLVIPFILNLLFTFKIIKHKKWFNNSYVSSYFYKNKIFIPISIVVMDVLLALKFTKSKFLGLNVFNSGITSYEIFTFEYIKIISITIFENIPTILIQIIFMIQYEYNILSLVSIIFSGFSIFITILNYFMNRERVNESIPVSCFIVFKVDNKHKDKIKAKIGLQRQLKEKIFNIIGSTNFNDIEIGSINMTPFRNKYFTKIHCISRINKETINDTKPFQFDPETVTNV